MPAPNLGTTDTTAIPTDGEVTTEDITDTDTLTDTGGRDLPKNNNQNLNILSNDPLMLMLMPAPNPGTMDTTAIPTDGEVTTEDITDTVIPDTTGARIFSSDPTALTTIHTFLSAAIFKFKKSKFDDRNYCVNIHQNWDLSAKFFI